VSKLTIIVSGMVSAVPLQGGAAWAVLQYLLGFKHLGHDVYFVEPISSTSLLPQQAALADSDNAAYFRAVMAEFGFERSSALLPDDGRTTVGMPYDHLRQVVSRADLLGNISGLLRDAALLERIPVRLYLDLDPAFTQLWQFTQDIDVASPVTPTSPAWGSRSGSPGAPYQPMICRGFQPYRQWYLIAGKSAPGSRSTGSPPWRTGAGTARSNTTESTTDKRHIHCAN
jgi:hypothetical protein